MSKYIVTLEATVFKTETVEANSEAEAEEKFQDELTVLEGYDMDSFTIRTEKIIDETQK